MHYLAERNVRILFYLFLVCPKKTLNLTFRVELLAHHHSEHTNNNDLTMCKSCTGLKNGICITQKLSHIYPHEGALGELILQ